LRDFQTTPIALPSQNVNCTVINEDSILADRFSSISILEKQAQEGAAI